MLKPFNYVWGLVCWIRAGGGCVSVGETVWNILKRVGTKKRGGEIKILKVGGGGKLSQGVSALKKGAGTPLRTMLKKKL